MDLSVHGHEDEDEDDEEEEEIPIPMPKTSASNHAQPHHHIPSNGPPLPPHVHHYNHQSKVKYRECLKNHAASIGGNATDGCGEFMPSGDEGTMEALKCSACSCHRNFHRRVTEGDDPEGFFDGSRQKGLLIPRAPPHHHWVMPLGALHHSSESDHEVAMARPHHPPLPSPLMVKKRFRTKFTPEQKEKMLRFAERVGWKLQKLEDSVVQQFCQEIGVKRRVLKVWMHNNKHGLAKKTSLVDHDDQVE